METEAAPKHHDDHVDHSHELAERTATIEFDGGLSREDTEQRA